MLGIEEVKAIVTEYLKYNNYAPATVESYLRMIRLFGQFLLKERKVKDFRDVKEKDIYLYMEYRKSLSNAILSTATKVSHFGTIKTVYQILAEEDKILFNPFSDSEYIKRIRNIRDKILTEEEMTKLMNIFDISKPVGFRDRMILEVLYATGIRSKELCNLDIRDFIKDEKLLFIREGKGKKDRILPLGEHIFKRLLYYIEKVRPKVTRKKEVKYLFTRLNSKQFDGKTLRIVIKDAVRDAEIKKIINPHTIRHTFATHLLNNGADIREVQLLLGHANLKATEIYLNLTTNHLKEVYEKYHPLENELYFDVYGREGYIFKDGFPAGIRLLSKNILTDI